MNILMVFLGGGLGSLCRYGIGRWLTNQSLHFPTATLVSNIASCLLMGLLLGWMMRHGLSESWKLLLITGFCGGFSTFSTFSFETLQLFQNGAIAYAFANIFLSLLICLFCLYLGTKITLAFF